MKETTLKQQLAGHQLTLGSWIQIADPTAAQIMADAGLDWLVIDMEHSSIDICQVVPLILAIESGGAVPLVRVPENDAKTIGRVMDCGAHGVLVPNVRSADEAAAAVAAVKYPPAGERGVGLYRAQGFGRGFDDYKRWLADESIVIVQIEDVAAVGCTEAIFSTPGIDGFMIGPYDLSASLGKPGDYEDEEVVAAMDSIEQSARACGLASGFHCVSADPEYVARCRDRGYAFIAVSGDALLLARASSDLVDGFRRT